MPIDETKHEITTSKQDYLHRLIQDETPLIECAKLTGLHIKTVRAHNRRWRQTDLAHPRSRKLASCALHSILKGKPFGEVKEIKDSTVMSAIKEVYERVQPKTSISLSRSESSVTVTHKIDMTEYQDIECVPETRVEIGPDMVINGEKGEI